MVNNKPGKFFKALLYPIAIIVYFPDFVKNLRKKHRNKNKKAKQLISKRASASPLYNDFSVQKTKDIKISFSDHMAVFRSNGLSYFEAFYNAAAINLREKSEAKEHTVSDEYTNLITPPHGFFKNEADTYKDNFWDKILHRFAGFAKFFGSLGIIGTKISDTKKKIPAGVLRAAKLTGVTACVLFVTIHISSMMSYDIGYKVFIDGAEFCTVSEKRDFLDAKSAVENFYTESSGSIYRLENTFEYKLAPIDRSSIISTDECYNLLNAGVSELFTDGTALYIDGKFVAAYTDRDSLMTLLVAIEKHKTDIAVEEDPENLKGVRIRNSIETVDTLCLKSDFKTISEIYQLLCGRIETEVIENVSDDIRQEIEALALTDSEDDDSIRIRIGAFTAASPNISDSAANYDIDYGVVLNTIDPALDVAVSNADGRIVTYETVKTEVVTEDIPFETIYQESANYFEGTENEKVSGITGRATNTYEVAYVDGVEVSRTIVESIVLQAKRDRIVIVGTTPIPSTDPTGTFIWPVTGTISSKYGARTLFGRYDFHLGIDITGSLNKLIKASDGGTVSFAGTNGSYGKIVVIDHANGMQTAYAHLNEILVNKGDKVYQGQHIGKMGRTGTATGVHVHFEVRVSGKTANPLNYLP